MADVERAERELGVAKKQVKALEEELRRARKDIESLSLQKRGLQEDLQRLLAKRSDIENLQSTLQNLVANSHGKKIDVDELKQRLAEQFRGANKGTTGGKSVGASTLDVSNSMSRENFNYLNGASKKGRSGRSKSPHGGAFEEMMIPERGSAVKDLSMSGVAEPAWYRALKKNTNK